MDCNTNKSSAIKLNGCYLLVRNPVTPDSPQALIASTAPSVGVVAQGIIDVIILVIAFVTANWIKGRRVEYRRYHGLVRELFDDLLFRFFSQLSFFIGGDEYRT